MIVVTHDDDDDDDDEWAHFTLSLDDIEDEDDL